MLNYFLPPRSTLGAQRRRPDRERIEVASEQQQKSKPFTRYLFANLNNSAI